MPPTKRQRRGSRNAGNRGTVSKVPRAIATRGTPSGYYEINSNTLMRFYGNGSTGLWNTDQNTGAQSGTTGYQGLAFFSTLSSMQCSLGNGTQSATVNAALGQFSQLANVFDLCKIVSIELEFWFTNQTGTVNGSAVGCPELWLVQDPNDATPLSSAVEVQDYSKFKRVIFDQKSHKMTFKPFCNILASTGQTDTTTTYANSLSSPSAYFNTKNDGVCHFGVKGWMYLPSAQAAETYMLNVAVRQVRRYKNTK